jgi:hypothetical protein
MTAIVALAGEELPLPSSVSLLPAWHSAVPTLAVHGVELVDVGDEMDVRVSDVLLRVFVVDVVAVTSSSHAGESAPVPHGLAVWQWEPSNPVPLQSHPQCCTRQVKKQEPTKTCQLLAVCGMQCHGGLWERTTACATSAVAHKKTQLQTTTMMCPTGCEICEIFVDLIGTGPSVASHLP